MKIILDFYQIATAKLTSRPHNNHNQSFKFENKNTLPRTAKGSLESKLCKRNPLIK